MVLSRDEYTSRYISHGKILTEPSRIGDIVVIGISPSFKSIMSTAIHEHGSLTLDEMLVGMGVMVD